MSTRGSIDRLTVVAIAFIAYASANIAHEIVGHCGMALVVGTKCTIISSTNIPLATFPPTWKYNIIVVAGCTANFVVALVSLVLLRRAGPLNFAPSPDLSQGERKQTVLTARRGALARSTLGYFLWLLMAVNLFLPSTYIAVAPIIRFGDSYILIQNLPGQIFWRLAVSLAGAAVLWISFWLCRKELGKLIGIGGRAGRAIAWELIVPAYIAGGVLTVTSALFSQLPAKIAQLEAAGGTFGLTIWLLLLPLTISRTATSERSPLTIARSIVWILLGALTALIFIGVLGRGIGV